MDVLMVAPISGIISIIVALYLYFYVKKQSAGTPKMKDISDAIREGAVAYLKRQYKTLSIFVIVLAVIITFALGPKGPSTAIAYVIVGQ
jgi:K(+)-stimulated pyrophosphate-energized sodium pump